MRFPTMAALRSIEIFSSGCPLCEESIAQIRAAACPSCKVNVLDIRETTVADYASRLGVRSVPAVAIDGVLASCCSSGGPDLSSLQAAGLGQV